MDPVKHSKNKRLCIYSGLMQGFASSQQRDKETRWAWLIAAHVVGQHAFSLHCRNHVAMLRFALELKDYPEAAGQLFRLILMPFGHALGKLPAGNIGRATVSAFKPMALDEPFRRLILEAQTEAAADIKQS